MIQDLIQRQFGVEYHPHYICTLLHNLGFSYQKARFVSDHLDEAKRLEWRQQTWPAVLRRARQRKALLLFGDEASFHYRTPFGPTLTAARYTTKVTREKISTYGVLAERTCM